MGIPHSSPTGSSVSAIKIDGEKNLSLVGGFNPSKKALDTLDDCSQYMEK